LPYGNSDQNIPAKHPKEKTKAKKEKTFQKKIAISGDIMYNAITRQLLHLQLRCLISENYTGLR